MSKKKSVKSEEFPELEYDGEFQTTVNVHIKYEEGLLIAWTDDCMEDGFDYEPYEKRLRNGEDFETICQEIVKDLSEW